MLVGLAAATSHLGPGEGAGGALAGIGQLTHHRPVQQVSGRGLFGDLQIKGSFAALLALPIVNNNICHGSAPQDAPLLPTRLAGRMSSKAPGLPGTEPFTTSRLRSTSTLRMVRPRVVICLPP